MSDRTSRPAVSAHEDDLELTFYRALAAHRISRRQLLETAARIGPVAALGPILAACSSSGVASPSPVSPPPSVGPSVAPPASASAPPPSPSPSAAPTPVPTPEGELNVYNWDAYIGEKTVSEFTAKTGIKVHYDKFPDAETMLAKIRSDGKGAGYDICYPTSVEIPGLVADGIIQPLKLDLIPNATNLGAQWQNPGYDPGNANSMPYMWWTTGFCWNGDKIKDDLTSWESLWNPAYKGKLSMLDDIREVFAVAAFRLGLDPNTKSADDLDKMAALLEEQKPLVRTYTTDDIGVMNGGDAIIAHAWSGDVYQMYDDVPNVKYVIPKEGAVRGSDTMVITSGAPHPIAANLWINFNLDAKVSAANTNFIGYMGPNAAAMQYIDKAILEDATVNPDIALLDKLVELLNLGPDLDKYTQRWNALKA
jgi:spermidine/putrescine transport system substrate-binding protein